MSASAKPLSTVSVARDELISRVIDLCIAQMQEAIEELMTEGVDPLECLQRFAAKAFEQRELVTFMMKYWDQSGQMALVDAQWRKIIDGFFLRGNRRESSGSTFPRRL